jgi:hypothetical protein
MYLCLGKDWFPSDAIAITRNAWTVKEYCSLFIGTRHSLWGITIMPLIKVYNNDSNTYGLKGHSTFKSVRNSEASWTATFGHHVQTASAEAVSSCRTFGDEAWSQQQSVGEGKCPLTHLCPTHSYNSFPAFTQFIPKDWLAFVYLVLI